MKGRIYLLSWSNPPAKKAWLGLGVGTSWRGFNEHSVSFAPVLNLMFKFQLSSLSAELAKRGRREGDSHLFSQLEKKSAITDEM